MPAVDRALSAPTTPPPPLPPPAAAAAAADGVAFLDDSERGSNTAKSGSDPLLLSFGKQDRGWTEKPKAKQAKRSLPLSDFTHNSKSSRMHGFVQGARPRADGAEVAGVDR